MQSYEKTGEEQKENRFFFLLFRVLSKFGEAKVTKKREKLQRFLKKRRTFAPKLRHSYASSYAKRMPTLDRKSDMNALDNASIQDENSLGLTSFAFPEAKSSKTGVSVRYAPREDKEWYVLRIKYGQAQAVANALIENDTYVYLAKVWKDIRNKETGKKQRKLFPFMNLIFAYMTEQEAEKYVKDSTLSKYATYYYNHFVTDENGYNPPLVVSSRDMALFVKATALLDEHVMEVDLKTCRFVSDELVRVTAGPFEGIIGRVARIARQKRVVIHIKGLQSGLTTAYIPPYFLEKVESD